jgi:putative heme iron utilization protein
MTRVAALGTREADGSPFVSMVPFAMDPFDATLVIHVSELAPHTSNLKQNSLVSVLIMQAPIEGEPVHALPRVSFKGHAKTLQLPTNSKADEEDLHRARNEYLKRFPEATPMTELGDFRFVRIRLVEARQVAGFGAARTLTGQDIEQILRAES